MMRKYELVLFAQRGKPEERVAILGNSPDAAFGWAERHAHGRRFEIFENGKSLGVASLAHVGNFWMLSAPSTGSNREPPPVGSEPKARAPVAV